MDDHNNNYNYTDINIGFGVPFHDPYEVPFSPSYFNVTNPTLDDLSNINDNNINNNNGAISSYCPLPQQQNFNNGISTSYSALPPLPQQQDFTNGGFSASYSPLPQQQDYINNGGVSASYSALPSLPQQQDFTNNGFQLQQGQGSTSTSYPFSYPMNPLMQDQFSQSNFSIGGQQQQGGVVAGNFQQEVSSTLHIGEQSQQSPNGNDQGVTQSLKLGVYRDYWPPTKAPFFCNCCEVLRVILHTNGKF